MHSYFTWTGLKPYLYIRDKTNFVIKARMMQNYINDLNMSWKCECQLRKSIILIDLTLKKHLLLV